MKATHPILNANSAEVMATGINLVQRALHGARPVMGISGLGIQNIIVMVKYVYRVICKKHGVDIRRVKKREIDTFIRYHIKQTRCQDISEPTLEEAPFIGT